jgi:short-subunit dehydrogenase
MRKGNTILVTGASSGIGKATAELLLKEGHTVYCAARRVEKMQQLKEKGGIVIGMDVTDDLSMKNGVNQIIKEQGRIDVLINNAGYAIYGSVEETTIEDARRQFDVNIFGLARLTQLIIPHMREQQSGKIINVSSMGGKVYTPLGAWYHATKHALEGWSDCLRLELKDFGIDVVIIEPGLISTEFGDVMTAPMVERSGNGPYQALTRAVENGVKDSYDKPNSASPPSVIADVISQAVKSKKPKTRYVKGKLAGPILFMRKWLSDRTFDKLIMSQTR